MEQGRTEKRMLEDCHRYRMPVPDAIANAPELQFGSDFYLSAYLELSSCRTDGPIPWTAIADYCIAHHLDDDMVSEMMFIVRTVDGEMSELRAAKREAEMKASAKHRTRS
jgi:hypothetical protein